MKKYLLSLFLIPAMTSAFCADSITDNSNVWSYIRLDSEKRPGHLVETGAPFWTKFTRDSVVHDTVYRVLQQSWDENQDSWADYALFRQQGDSVFRRVQEIDHLVFDFSLEIGDTLRSAYLTGIDTLYITPIEIQNVDDQGISKKTIRVKLWSRSYPDISIEDTWVDQFGSTIMGLFPEYNPALNGDGDGDVSDILNCFETEGVQLYYNSSYSGCFVTVGATSINADNVEVYPLPFRDEIVISTDGEGINEFVLYDSQGSVSKKGTDEEIATEDLPLGFYVLKVLTVDGISHTFTLVKE